MVIFEGSLAGSDPVGAQNHRRRMPAVEGSLGSMGRHRRAGAHPSALPWGCKGVAKKSLIHMGLNAPGSIPNIPPAPNCQ